MNATPLCVALGLVLLASGGCLDPEDECAAGSDRCVGAEARRCEGIQVPAGSKLVWKSERCASAARCQVVDGKAFCSVGEQPDPRCDGVQEVCDGDLKLACHRGYTVVERQCLACTGHPHPDFSTSRVCHGGVLTSCDLACLPGLQCVVGECAAPCGCPEGSRCTECDAFGLFAQKDWHCVSGYCALKDR